MSNSPGVVTVSLDTELAWGCFDTVGVAAHELAYAETRSVIERLCQLFTDYDVSATWALVAHLIDDCSLRSNRHNEMIDPGFEWIDNWADSLPCQSGVDEALWYAPEILETIQDCPTNQEIGLHGYSHMILDEKSCQPDAARQELNSAVSVAEEVGIVPESFVYPRNRIGFRSILADRGFGVYRSPDANWYEQMELPEPVKKGLRFATECLMTTPPPVTPTTVDDLIAVPGSQVFRPSHSGWQYTPSNSQRVRAKKGIERAAKTGEIFHLWFHPFNLAREPDKLLSALEDVLQHVANQRAAGRIEVLSMAEIAQQFRDGRWQEEEMQ
ncbi:DUF2334 domain-containing protein [Halorarum halobium]|uniref:DUF2334 domain-containing protein n=1 Tax=Halorarum halobium TaxID=3075121 RepID=UPI0028A9E261|nr:polysaccharide deacetylase family protein [Halobaculum sp. XH14]